MNSVQVSPDAVFFGTHVVRGLLRMVSQLGIERSLTFWNRISLLPSGKIFHSTSLQLVPPMSPTSTTSCPITQRWDHGRWIIQQARCFIIDSVKMSKDWWSGWGWEMVGWDRMGRTGGGGDVVICCVYQ